MLTIFNRLKIWWATRIAPPKLHTPEELYTYLWGLGLELNEYNIQRLAGPRLRHLAKGAFFRRAMAMKQRGVPVSVRVRSVLRKTGEPGYEPTGRSCVAYCFSYK